ncbi:MAG: class I SAM-dependent methyltransferase [Weeksellaceae bacterium]|nr:class I SAM-dependent methyltransferase [Weeksellaceae bacterium]
MERYIKDHFLTGEEFSVVPHERYDGVLQTVFDQPLDQLEKYYQSEEYLSHSKGNSSPLAKVYSLAQRANLRWKLKHIQRFLPEGKLLDYGCGKGDFVHYMQGKGYSAYGYEPNIKAADLAQDAVGESILQWQDLPRQAPYDAICLWHVLEHIPDLEEKFTQLLSWLKEGGWLFVALPNYKSLDAEFYGDLWAGYDVPRHLWHFSREGFSEFIADFGIVMEEQVGMPMDAYYVSLLSERYKRSSLSYWNAMQMGLKSNLAARKNGEFSSILYVLNKRNAK